MGTTSCILALDLGTSAFKAAAVAENFLIGKPTIVRYTLDYNKNFVTCDPEKLYRSALRALRGAAKTAREQGLQVSAIGISSQAQTYLALDAAGTAVQPAIIWTDGRATAQAELAAQDFPDFALTSGFLHPSPLQFLPKVRYFQRRKRTAQRFLLLNEWLIYRLTGETYGDEINQGMGGFYDIQARAWSERALEWAWLTPENLAQVAPAASISAPLRGGRKSGLPEVPVYSCGNDQSCAAVGAGLERAGDILCNFGTAMVVYAQKDRPVAPTKADQIAGIGPMTSQRAPSWFLLGLEPECGNVFDWLAKLLYPRGGVETLLNEAFTQDMRVMDRDDPQIVFTGGGRLDLCQLKLDYRREHVARGVVSFYVQRFRTLLQDVRAKEPGPLRLFASGGLSQNDLWMEFLPYYCGWKLTRTASEHPGLAGIARIIQNGSGNGTSI